MIYNGIELYNIEELLRDEEREGFLMSRIPGKVRSLLNENARQTAFDGPGCEIRFNIKGESVSITLSRVPTGGKTLDTGLCEVYFGSFQGVYSLSPRIIEDEPVIIKISKPENIKLMKEIARKKKLPFDPELVRVFLPYDWPSCLLNIEGDCSPPEKGQAPGKKFLAYGSSITHGSTSLRPSGIFTRQLADRLGYDQINLGFAGSAHLDKELAAYIADRGDWEFAVLELGINVIEIWNVEKFYKQVDYFITKITEKNPGKLLFCIDIFTCARDFEGDEKVKVFRQVVRDKVKELNRPELIYISGRELLTAANGLTADLLHPSAVGMKEIANKLYEIIKEKLSS